MATPGGKKPNKQQAVNAGNEIGLDLANAIGKAINRTLSTYDFSPIGKSISKSIGKIDIAALLKTDDAKVKQLAVNAKATLEKGIGNLKIATEVDNDKLISVQKTLQQLSNFNVEAAIGNLDTTILDKELAQIKPVDIEAIVNSVDSTLISTEVNKLNPLDIQTSVASVDTSLISKEIDALKPFDISASVSTLDTTNLTKELTTLKPADVQAIVSSVDSTLIDSEVNKLKPIDLLAKVNSVDTGLIDIETGKLKVIDLQAAITAVDIKAIDAEISKVNPIDLQAVVNTADLSLIAKEASTVKPIDILAKVNTVDSTLIATETSKLKPIDLQAAITSVDSTLIDAETGKLKSVELMAGIANLDTSLIDSTIGKLKSSELQATISTVNTDLIATEIAKVNPIELQAKVSSVDTSTLLAEIGKLKPAELKALLTEVDTSLVNTEFSKLKIADLQALVTEVDTSLIGEEISKLNPLALQAKLTELDSSAINNIPQASVAGNLEVDTTTVQNQIDNVSPVSLNNSINELVNTFKNLGKTIKDSIGTNTFAPVTAGARMAHRASIDLGASYSEIVDSTKDLIKQTELSNQVARNSAVLGGDRASAYATYLALNKEELVLAAELLGIEKAESMGQAQLAKTIADKLDKLEQTKELNQFIASSYGDMSRGVKQVEANIKLKNVMVKTGLTGEYAENARLKQLQLEQGVISEKEYATALSKLKTEHHIYEEKAKQLELTEALAQWQLGMNEELEEYEKGWEKIKSKVKAIITDPKLSATVFATEGIKTVTEGFKKFGEGFDKMKEKGLSAGQAATAQMKTMSTMSVLGLSDTQGVMEQVIESYGNANALSSSQVDDIGQMAHHMGITGQEAMKVNETLSQMGGETTESATEAMHFTENLAKASGVAPGKIMKDIAKNSAAVALYSKDGAKGFGKAAVELHKMGVEISTASKMADGLLDFENRINKQMEASVLLGREINLDKAAELALNGDLEGATREVLNNIGGAAEFTKMSVVQKKALAEAAGMTVEEMQKALDAEEEQQKYHGEESAWYMSAIGYAKEYGGAVVGFAKEHGMLLLSGLNTLANQESRQFLINGLQKGFNLLASIGSGIMKGGLSVVRMIFGEKAAGYLKDKAQWALEKAHIGWLKVNAFFGSDKAKAKLADMAKDKLAGGVTDKAKDLVADKAKEKATDLVEDKAKEKATSLVEDKAGDLADKAADKGTEKLTGVAEDKAGDLAGKATEGADKLGEGGEKVGKKGMTEGFKDNMTNIAEGFKQMGQGGVLKGIFNTMLAGPALVVALPAIPFLLFMGKVSLKELEPNFKNLGEGLEKMSKTFAGSLALGVFAVAAIPSIASIPFLLFMGLVPLKQLQANFEGLGKGLQSMSKSFVGSLALGLFAIAGAAAVATLPFLLGISLIGKPAELGLKALGRGLAAFGNPEAALFVLIGIGLLAALGVAMIPFAAALAIATPAIEAFGNIIIGIFQQIPPIIAAVAAGFTTVFGVLADNWQILIPAGIGLQFLGAGLFVLGAAALVATPGIIAFGLAMAIAGPAITQLAIVIGDVLIKAMEKLPAIIDAVSAGFVTIFSTLAQNWQILIPVGVGLAAVAVGLGALGGAALLAFPGLLLASIGLSMMQAPLAIINAVAQTDAIPKLAQSFMMLAALGPGLLVFSISLGALGAAGMLAFPGLVLAGAGLLAMAPGLLMLNTVAQTGVISTLAQSITELGSAGGGLAAVGLSLLGVAGGLAAVAGASIISIPAIGVLAGAFALATLPMLAFGAAAAVAGAGIVAAAYGLSQLSVSLPTIVSAGPGLLAVGIGLGVLGTTAALAFPGLLLAGAGLMAMVPGLFLVNQVAQADALIALSQTLTALSAASTGLAVVGASLFGIAGGLGAIAIAGFAAMPIIGALAGLATVAPMLAGLGSLFGGGGGGEQQATTQTNTAAAPAEDGKMDILISEIRSLKEIMSKGGVINMDGKKVGDVVRLAMNTSGVR